jgi:translation initiation factor IF-1
MKEADAIVETTGTVIASLASSCFKVKLDDPQGTIVARLAGELRQHCVRCRAGDTVELRITSHGRGCITWRFQR